MKTDLMTMSMQAIPRGALLTGALAAALWLAGCAPATLNRVPGQLSDATASVRSSAPAPAPASRATDLRSYRQDAAGRIYALNAARIYQGQLPPVLYAVGTLRVDLEADGRVRALHWLRAPQHAPEAIAQIERLALDAAPYPVAPRIGALSWTDTWLWDKSGRFQLDTLTEGQQQP